jgi:hypothetical protein
MRAHELIKNFQQPVGALAKLHTEQWQRARIHRAKERSHRQLRLGRRDQVVLQGIEQISGHLCGGQH